MSSIAPSSQSKIRSLIPPWLTGRWGILGLLLILHTLGFLIWIQFYGGGEEKISTITSLAALPPMLLHVLLAWRVAMQKQFDFDLRKAWFLLGLGTLLSFLGDLIWAYLENALQVEPFPSIADIFYLGSYALVLWGLFSMPGAPLKRHDRLTFWFNLLVAMITGSMFVGYFVIVPTVSMHNTDLLTTLLAAAYLVFSLMILAGVLSILLRLPESNHRTVLLLLLAGVSFFLASDLAFGYTNLSGTYVSGGWIDAGWQIARVFMVLAALCQMDTRVTSSAKPRRSVPFNSFTKRLPLLAGLLGYGLVFTIVITNGGMGRGIWACVEKKSHCLGASQLLQMFLMR